MRVVWWFVVAQVGVGCWSSRPPAAPEAVEWTGPPPTFADVGPIYEQRCVSCHQDGGIGPFRLDSYDDAQQWAMASAVATQARSMPPFLVAGDGTCGEFQNNQWLTGLEVATIGAWAEAGAPEGDGHTFTRAEPPALQGDTVQLSTPDFEPEIVGGEYAQFDEYRCFAVDVPIDEDRFLTGYEVLPGNEAMVHHVIGMPVDYEAPGWYGDTPNGEIIERLDAADTREGWPCFEGAGDGVSFPMEVVSWAPGQGPVVYPAGVGLRIPAGTKMVFQVHYNLVDPEVRGQRDQTEVALRLESAVEREAYVTLPDLFLGGNANVDALPPGEPSTQVQFSVPFRWLVPGGQDYELIGILPHMHERGRTMHVEIGRGPLAPNTCAALVRNWDFEWQRMYFYEKPIAFRASNTLHVACTYDTTDDTAAVLPGWGTGNEMCLAGLIVTLAR